MAQNLTVKKGQCINFGNCKKADGREVIEVNLGDDFICPGCEEGLIEVRQKEGFPLKWILTGAGVLIVLAGAFIAYRFAGGDKPDKETEQVIDRPIAPDGITLDKTSLSFEKAGETAQITATVLPDDAKDKSVVWKSSNEAAAKVDGGLVTAVDAGSAVISAQTGNGLSANCEVKVTVKEQSDGQSKSGNDSKISVSGGVYTGQTKNGQPHGMGTIRYGSRTLIDSRDAKKRYAEAEQYISGEFYNGRLVQGKLFDKENNQIETIVLGRAN
jgi:hypothetical protein